MEILIWVAFLVIYSIFQALAEKKKKERRLPSAGEAGDESEGQRPATLQDALREIQEALQQAQRPAPPPEPEPRATTSKPRKVEPEFHSMERPVKSENLEAQTRYRRRFSERMLEKATTYENTFPEATYADDRFQHAHPDLTTDDTQPVGRKKAPVHRLKARLSSPDSLREAVIFREVLGRPRSMRRR